MSVKLTIDLDNEFGCDDETIARLLLQIVQDEIRKVILREVKSALGERQKEIKKLAQDAVRRDWRNVEGLLKELQKISEGGV